MLRAGLWFALIVASGLMISGVSVAQTSAPAAKNQASSANEVDSKIKAAVEERAKKRKQALEKRLMAKKKLNECRKQATEQKLRFAKRRAFLKECMTED